MGRSKSAPNRNQPIEVGETRRGQQRAFLIAAGRDPHAGLPELKELLSTAGAQIVGEATQLRDDPHPDSYLGSGKIDEVAEQLEATRANLVVCDDELSPRQERTLEKRLSVPVIDRTAVILDIFALHAGSAEGKLQVELAQLEYNLARMRGLWTHLERLGGGIGTRGPGESQIETDRRLARDRVSSVRRRLRGVEATRARMRAERERTSIPSIALVGYTNAGKSTLMRALTGAEVGIRDELFHTLDPTTRVLESNGRAYVMTDTVGFIRKLPHQLVDAFAATLEETIRSDLLIVVSDGSAAELDRIEQLAAVEETLRAIGADEIPRIDVINKVDLLDHDQRAEATGVQPDAIQVSAVTGEGLDLLLEASASSIRSRLEQLDLLIPHSDGRTIDQLHRIAGDLTREDLPEGVRISVRLNPAQADRYRRFSEAVENR
ncbi:MAG: GTPase HflX [Solirubrobacterales bacterium]|nr:GTPase HflX [Solirubrobacterales bacterium]